jgi:hypothetical protein
MKPRTLLKHKASGGVVVFIKKVRSHRGITKIETSGPWGPLDILEFEVVSKADEKKPEVEKEAAPPKWPLKTSPEAYLKRYGAKGGNREKVALAKRILEWQKK